MPLPSVNGMRDVLVLAQGLASPGAPFVTPGGDVLLPETGVGRLSRVSPDGRKDLVAEVGGSPIAAIMVSDGACLVCDAGSRGPIGQIEPIGRPSALDRGAIKLVELSSGRCKTVYEHCDGGTPISPVALAQDAHGGIWVADFGVATREARLRGAIFYCQADGSHIERVIPAFDGPVGIGLSPQGDRLYVAEEITGRVWRFDLSGPGKIVRSRSAILAGAGHLLIGLPGFQKLGPISVCPTGELIVAVRVNGRQDLGGYMAISPAGEILNYVEVQDGYPGGLCFAPNNPGQVFASLTSAGLLIAFENPATSARIGAKADSHA